jgi:acyl carrier protein
MTCLTDSADGTLLDLVRAAVSTVLELPVESLDADTRLAADVEVDSLAMIEIVEIVEEQLRAQGSLVRIEDESLARMQTIADVVSAFGTAPRTSAPL